MSSVMSDTQLTQFKHKLFLLRKTDEEQGRCLQVATLMYKTYMS